MAGRHQLQNTFTSGELDPLLASRQDVKFYYLGAKQMKNVVVLPQGGFRARPGMETILKVRNKLSAVSMASATVTAPGGGTPDNIKDGDAGTLLVTGSIGSTSPFVICHVDFGSAKSIDFVDIENYKLSTGTLDDQLFVQYSVDDASWSNFGPAFNATDTERTRRRKAASTVSARYWRIVRIGSGSVSATMSIANIYFWVVNSTIGNARSRKFAFSTERHYQMIFTDRNINVVEDGLSVGSVPIPHGSDDILTLNFTQSLDTMLIFHPDYPPWRIFRQGSGSSVDEWDSRAQEFENIPQFDFGNSPGGVDEVQKITFADFTAGDTFNLVLDGERTGTLTYDASISTTASDIQSALRSLAVTSDDGISCVGSGTSVTITFGGDDGKKDWPEIFVGVITSATGVGNPVTLTEGEPPGEDIMSDSRGWPRCGTFYQGRTYLGGFKSLPEYIAGSVVGAYFDFNNKTTRDDYGFLIAADTDTVSAIYQIFPGQHLQIFTSGIEFFVPSEPITPLTVALKQTTRRGIKEGLPIEEVDGAALFVQRQGNTIRENTFIGGVVPTYAASNISLLSSHLINDPVDVGLRRSADTDEADWYIVVNEDGTGAVLTTLRDQDVTAWVSNDTDGIIRSVSTDNDNNVYFIVERSSENGSYLTFEKWNENLYMDAGAILTVSTPTDQLAGLDDLEGKELKFYIDGSPAGSAAVSGGVVILPTTAYEEIKYGLDYEVVGETMPIEGQLPDGTSVGRQKKVISVDVSIVDTVSLDVGANSISPRPVSLKKMGDELLDYSADDLRYTGIVRVDPVQDWNEEATVVVKRGDPGPFTVRAIKYEVAY